MTRVGWHRRPDDEWTWTRVPPGKRRTRNRRRNRAARKARRINR